MRSTGSLWAGNVRATSPPEAPFTSPRGCLSSAGRRSRGPKREETILRTQTVDRALWARAGLPAVLAVAIFFRGPGGEAAPPDDAHPVIKEFGSFRSGQRTGRSEPGSRLQAVPACSLSRP